MALLYVSAHQRSLAVAYDLSQCLEPSKVNLSTQSKPVKFYMRGLAEFLPEDDDNGEHEHGDGIRDDALLSHSAGASPAAGGLGRVRSDYQDASLAADAGQGWAHVPSDHLLQCPTRVPDTPINELTTSQCHRTPRANASAKNAPCPAHSRYDRASRACPRPAPLS